MLTAYSQVWIMCFAAVFGLIAGRPIGMEGEDRRTAILGAGYVGAGTGLLTGPPAALLLTLVGLWSPSTSTTNTVLWESVEDFGGGLLWGPIGGAAGGVLVGLVVVMVGARR
jgi:hypothetical protein